jgi:alpha-tubulin suppressor-like RCC1 family protein
MLGRVSRSPFSASLGLVLLLVAAAGCEPRASLGTTCAYDSQCGTGLTCRFGRCRAECLEDVDCRATAGLVCNAGVCAQPDEACREDADCASPELACADTICAVRCTSSDSCGDSVCDTRRRVPVCVPASTIGMDAGVTDAFVAPDAPDAGSDAGPDAPEPLDSGTDAPSTDAGTREPAPTRLCAARGHACAIRGDRVYCWGSAGYGELGDSESPMSLVATRTARCGRWPCASRPERPVQRPSGPFAEDLVGATSIACGETHACALVGDQVWCWGSSGSGYELGHDGLGYVAGQTVASGASSLVVGRYHGCAMGPGGTRCWGVNEQSFTVDGGMVDGVDGRLGFVGPSTRDAAAAPAFDGASVLAAGGHFTCRASADEVRCVGFNESDVTGLRHYGHDPVGSPVAGLAHPILGLSAGYVHACALGADGRAYCWGGDTYQVLASPTTVPECFERSPAFGCRPDALPARVEVGFDAVPLRALSRGLSDTMCAITRSGEVTCWGANDYGQAGVDPTVASRLDRLSQRVRVEDGGAPIDHAVEVACGAAFCCARRDDDEVLCWGENDLGQLGDGTTDSESYDGDVPDAGPTLSVPHPRARRVDFSLTAP